MFRRDEDAVLASYLLGKLGEAEVDGLEDRLLADEQVFERLLAVEEDLIDDYVRGAMSASRRRRFKARILTIPDGRARVELARALLSAADDDVSVVERRSRAPLSLRRLTSWGPLASLQIRTMLPVAALVLVVFAGLLWKTWDQVSQVPEAGLTTTASVVLLPGVRDAEHLPSLEVGSTTRLVELRSFVEDREHYQRFRGRLMTSRGEELWSSTDGPEVKTPDDELTVVLSLPAELLRSGQLLLELTGEDPDGRFELIDEYRFEVITRAR